MYTENSYEYTMTLTGALNLNEMPAAGEHYTIGAFINGVCPARRANQ